MRLLLAGGLLATVACVSGVEADEANATACDAMVGVWEYLEPSVPGHAIIAKHDGKYLGVFINTTPEADAPEAAPSTDSAKASSYPSSVAGAWEYTCEGTAGKLLLRLRWLFSSYQPQEVGSDVTLEVELEDGQAKWWFLSADGKRGAMGAGRLIR